MDKKPTKTEISKVMSIMGQKGGSANTVAQNKARAQNGHLGGRPAGSRNKKKKK